MKLRFSLIFPLICLSFLYLLVIFADQIAVYEPSYQNSNAGYMSPSKIYLDKKGFYIYERSNILNVEKLAKETKEITEQKFYLRFFNHGKLVLVDKPAYLNLLGTDSLGRDVFSRLVHGSRPSLTIGFIGLLIAFPLGTLYGGISGFAGGATDTIMMRVAEAIMSLPSFYLLIILSAMLPASLSNIERFAMITFILSFVSWAGLSRIIRGIVLSTKEKEFVKASQVMGQKYLVIVIKHLIPHSFSFLIIAATLAVPGFILGESALSFLGLGIAEPDASWGNILAESKDLSNLLLRPWLTIAPATCIFLAIFSFNLLGDYLRDHFDARSQ